MRITVEIPDSRIREDEPRAYEDAIHAFAAEWKRRVAVVEEQEAKAPLPTT